MYCNKRVSVVMPVYNESDSVKQVIEEFFLCFVVDEVIAVDNNSTDGSDQEIKKTKANYVLEKKQGYGAALQRGMREATGDLIVMVEPDATFIAKDIEKLLIYSSDFDAVFGTRTSRALILPNANMKSILRLGNCAVAKFLEYLFNGPSLTDVGCTFKLINRASYEEIKNKLTVAGSWFSPEFMIRVLQHNIKCVEVPIHYCFRKGVSKVTGKTHKAVLLGLCMIFFITKERIVSLFR